LCDRTSCAPNQRFPDLLNRIERVAAWTEPAGPGRHESSGAAGHPLTESGIEAYAVASAE